MELPKDLVAASSIPLILSILKQNDSYGYEIIKKVKELSASQINWSDGMLYPVLHRLEKQGFIKSYWQKAGQERKRKYYTINENGQTELAKMKKQWQMVNNTLNQAWKLDFIFLTVINTY